MTSEDIKHQFIISVVGAKREVHVEGEGECYVQVQCCFMSTETISAIRDGAQDGHLDFHMSSSSVLL